MASASRPPNTFLSLPAELRNTIYELSGCLDIVQCRRTSSTIRPHELLEKRRSCAPVNEGWAGCKCGLHCGSYLDDLGDTVDLYGPVMACHCALHAHDMKAGPPVPAAFLRVNWRSTASPTAEGAKQTQDFDDVLQSQEVAVRRMQHFYRGSTSCCSMCSTTKCRLVGLTQPALTKVSKKVRAETLPMFYGKHIFVFIVFEVERDCDSILRWLSRIGMENAEMLRKVVVLYKKKKVVRYFEKELRPEMAKLGARVGDGAVQLMRMKYPYCECEGCVMKVLVDRGGEDAEGGEGD